VVACGCYTSGSRIHSKTDWYKNLSKTDQAKAENGFTDSLNDGAKDAIVYLSIEVDEDEETIKFNTTAS
jgi:hypothetical protein